MMIDVLAGDTFNMAVTVQTDGVPIDIPSTAVVSAALVDQAGDVFAGPWSVLEATTGSDWNLGLIVVRLDGPAIDTAMTGRGNAVKTRLDVQIIDGSDTITHRSPHVIRIIRDTLP